MPFLNKTSGYQKVTRSERLAKLAKRNGFANYVVLESGENYVGKWKNGKKEGEGIMFSSLRNVKYEGTMSEDKPNGFGVLSTLRSKSKSKDHNISIYRGNWKNGKYHGYGLRIYQDGGFYMGDWSEGRRNGHGQMWYEDGSFYDGDWYRGQRSGDGLWVRSNGDRYEGAWANDKKHGKGRFFFLAFGHIQEGVWRKNSCVSSTIFGVPFRSAALQPSIIPIQPLELVNPDKIIAYNEWLSLKGANTASVTTFKPDQITESPSKKPSYHEIKEVILV